MLSLPLILICIAVGVLAGIFSGLLGIGGGLIIVPLLNIIFTSAHPEWPAMHIATSTSLLVICFSSFMTTYAQHQRGAVQWHVVKQFLPGMMLGVMAGIVIAGRMSTTMLQVIFGCFAGCLGFFFMLKSKKPTQVHFHFNTIIALLTGVAIGIASGILGLGGGVILIPILLLSGLGMVKVSATSSACTFPTALTGVLAAMFLDGGASELPKYFVGYVNIPIGICVGLASLCGAPIGVGLAHRLPVPIIKRIFGFVLLIIAWRMLELEKFVNIWA